MNLPKITVLMPVYNGLPFLPEAINSVLVQTFQDFEFLIINDGSTDKSENVIKKYQQKDNRIIYLKNEKNLGIQKTLNKGISLSRGEYIARMDSDDIWCDQDKLRKQINFLDANPDHALLGTAMETINVHGNKIQVIRYKETDNEIRDSILFSSQFAHPSIMIRKTAIELVGLYSEKEKYKHIEDYELWLRIGTRYKLANLKDVALKYRINNDGISLKNQFQQRLRGLILTIEYARKYPMGFKATCIKILTLFLSRNTLDMMISKSSLMGKMYTKFTGIRKNN